MNNLETTLLSLAYSYLLDFSTVYLWAFWHWKNFDERLDLLEGERRHAQAVALRLEEASLRLAVLNQPLVDERKHASGQADDEFQPEV